MKKAFKCALLALAKRMGLFAIVWWLTRGGVRILCYHGVWLGQDDFVGDSMFMSKSTFRRRLNTLRALNCNVISLDSAVSAFEGNAQLPPAPVVITIDDGWYSAYAEMLPALREYGMPATLYCDTANLLSGKPIAHMMAAYVSRLNKTQNYSADINACYKKATDRGISMDERLAATETFASKLGFDLRPLREARVFDYMTQTELRDAADSGLDVQLHTHNHSLHDHSPDRVRQEIEDNAAALATVLARPKTAFTHFCYPSGIVSTQAAAALSSLGLRSSTTARRALAWPSSPIQLLPRILDGESTTDIEFEAELSGFLELVRSPLVSLSSLFGSRKSIDMKVLYDSGLP
jgi:peptidoglycan/xylan/chitin deacetylase (PgdA/CDA1 family)